MNIASLISIVSGVLDKVRITLTQIPALLLLCTCSRRPGLSSVIMSAKIYADMTYAQNEYNDVVEAFVFNLVNRIKLAIQNDGVCFVAIPPGELKFQLTGGNAGGPFVLDGKNMNYVFAWTLMR